MWFIWRSIYTDDPNKKSILIKSGVDVAMGVVGTLGPVGFIISAAYFLIDPMGDKPNTEIKSSKLVPIDKLRRKIDIMELYQPNIYKLIIPQKEQPIIKTGKW